MGMKSKALVLFMAGMAYTVNQTLAEKPPELDLSNIVPPTNEELYTLHKSIPANTFTVKDIAVLRRLAAINENDPAKMFATTSYFAEQAFNTPFMGLEEALSDITAEDLEELNDFDVGPSVSVKLESSPGCTTWFNQIKSNVKRDLYNNIFVQQIQSFFTKVVNLLPKYDDFSIFNIMKSEIKEKTADTAERYLGVVSDIALDAAKIEPTEECTFGVSFTVKPKL